MRQLVSLLLCAALLTAADSAIAQPIKAGLIVLNKSDDTAMLLDPVGGEVLATLPTGVQPHEVAISPDGTRAVVTNYGTQDEAGNTLTVIDVVAAEVVGTIDLRAFTRPHGIAWIDDSRLAVTAEGAEALIVVDVDAGAVIQSVRTGRDVSHMVALSPDGRVAYVPDIRSGTVAVIALGEGRLVREVRTGAGAEGIGVAPDGSEVWVTNRAEDTISIIDAETLEVISTLEAGAFPIRAHFTPDGERVLVSNARAGDVSVFDATTREEIIRIRMDAPLVEDDALDRYFADEFEGSPIPIGITIDADGRRAYVANSNADVVVVINLDELAPVARFATGRQPDGIAIVPD